MSPIFRHEVQLRGTIRGRARGEARRPVRASLEYLDDEGQPALIPLRWNHDELELKPFLDQEARVHGFVGTDTRGYPVLYIHECVAVSARPGSQPASSATPGRATAG